MKTEIIIINDVQQQIKDWIYILLRKYFFIKNPKLNSICKINVQKS